MSSQRGLQGAIRLGSQRLTQAAVFREVLVVGAAGLRHLRVECLACPPRQGGRNGFFSDRRQIQTRGARSMHEVAVQCQVDDPPGGGGIIEAARVIASRM